MLYYRNALEGYEKPDGQLDESVMNLHNLVHDLVNGTSSMSHSAANDPIFVVILITRFTLKRHSLCVVVAAEVSGYVLTGASCLH